ncbi:MAG: hypothetical protein JXR68_06535 [Bacteroidales bacterium]|nr:hypothetical protein [Bacteroidales bacterium]
MKKITIIILFTTLALTTFSQSSLTKGAKSEYKYFGIKVGIINNFSLPLNENNNVLIKSPKGDLLKNYNIIPFTYTPGASFGIVYNFDFQNDKSGIVLGAEFSNFGFSNSYRSIELNYVVKEQIRVYSVGIPIYLKIGNNVYKNQFYGTFGMQYNIYFMPQSFQKSNWNEQLYIGSIDKQASRSSSVSVIAGVNYNVYFIKMQLLSSNFVSKDFSTVIEEGTIKPYQHLNITNNLYITAGVNIPFTRWLTARNWTAEKIRRFFKRAN